MTGTAQQRVVVRRARLSDAAEVARVHVDTWRCSYAGILPDRYLVGMNEIRNAAQWRRIIVTPACDEAVMVAERRGRSGQELVGFGSAGVSRYRRLGYQGEVYTLYVAPDWQGCGIGSRLLYGLFSLLARRDQHSALIAVLSANPARYFYEAQGGRAIADLREMFAGEPIRQTIYGWDDLPRWLATHGGARRSGGGGAVGE